MPSPRYARSSKGQCRPNIYWYMPYILSPENKKAPVFRRIGIVKTLAPCKKKKKQKKQQPSLCPNAHTKILHGRFVSLDRRRAGISLHSGQRRMRGGYRPRRAVPARARRGGEGALYHRRSAHRCARHGDVGRARRPRGWQHARLSELPRGHSPERGIRGGQCHLVLGFDDRIAAATPKRRERIVVPSAAGYAENARPCGRALLPLYYRAYPIAFAAPTLLIVHLRQLTRDHDR